MLTQCLMFYDVGQHAEALQGWRQTYDQLGRGRVCTRLAQLSTPHVQVFREAINIRVAQCGSAPSGRFSLALSLASAGQSVSVLRGRQEFFVQTCTDSDLIVVSVDEQYLQLLSSQGSSLCSRAWGASSLNLPPEYQAVLGRQLNALIQSGNCGMVLTEKHAEERALECILEVLERAVEHTRERGIDHAVSSYLVRRSQELALDCQQAPLTVLDICRHLRVSRRTLQRSFQQVAGVRPVEYLRAIRLNAVRRRLQQTAPTELSVAHAAVDQGFFHLGHFASYYKALFGECPSHTRRAA
ncbi:helix-turn-helix domain-containing protein [Pseudomonas sp. NPDC090592]|uniref:helix-turn-helix domain-containing protein n=1 Tax=Pseudomonas sp. NPDC090592 TaxID=3364480 RepID=UPI00383BA804